MAGIKSDDWFKQDYSQALTEIDIEEDACIHDEAFSMTEEVLHHSSFAFSIRFLVSSLSSTCLDYSQLMMLKLHSHLHSSMPFSL